jgi:hypothetical protein
MKMKKLKKQLRGNAKSVRKSVGRSVSDSVEMATEMAKSSPRRVAATVVGVAIAGAGVTAAARYVRSSNGVATLHVVSDGADGWIVKEEGAHEPVGVFGTKRKALRAARSAASESAPSDLVIHRVDGSVARSHHYEPS